MSFPKEVIDRRTRDRIAGASVFISVMKWLPAAGFGLISLASHCRHGENVLVGELRGSARPGTRGQQIAVCWPHLFGIIRIECKRRDNLPLKPSYPLVYFAPNMC